MPPSHPSSPAAANALLRHFAQAAYSEPSDASAGAPPPQLLTLTSVMLASKQPMFVAWGPQQRLLYNDAYVPILGERHPAAFDQPIGEVWADAWGVVGPIMDRAYAGESVHMDDLALFLQRQGVLQEAHFSFSYTPIYGDDGQVLGVFCACAEITRAVQAERTRLADEKRRLQIFQKAPGFIAVLAGPDHTFEFANDAYRRLAGDRRLVGRTVREVFPEIAQQGFLELLDTVYRSGERFVAHAMPVRLQATSDAAEVEHFLDFVYEPITEAGGRVTGIFVEGSDVTAGTLAQREQRRSDERFRAAIAAIGVLWTNDASGRMTGEQPGWAQLTGQSREAYEGYGWAQAVHPDDAAGSVDAWRAAVQERRTFVHEHRVRRHDDQWRRFSIRAVPIIDADGTLREWVGVHIDITEAAEAAEALRAADRRKDEFVATLAHELRNPLAPIRTAAHLLGRPHLSPERLAWCSDLIRRQSQTMAMLLDDLLDVSRITSGRLELRRAYVSVGSVVDSAIETARPLIDAKQHRLVTELPPELPLLDVDPLRVAQILTNLLTNAAKYTDPGGVIRIRARSLDAQVEFEVIDSGVGIAHDMLPSIFEMFRQVKTTMDRAEGGLGIGLALTRGLVQLHGGSIEAHSEGPGQGSRFAVRLPVAQEAQHRAQRRSPTRDTGVQPAGRRTVLVADDNVDAAKTLALMLELEGFDVHLAHDGVHALDLAQRLQPDAALLDIGMPGLNGYDVATRIRQQAWGHDVALVATTGWGQDEDRRRAAAAGFDQHLTKPVNPKEVLSWLQRRLAERSEAA